MATEVLDAAPAIPDISPVPDAARRNPILRTLSSVWFGIAVLTAILIYSSIISALPPVRWALELTEMQAFRHWFFVTLVLLFMVGLTTITIFRSRWTLLNAGSLLAHLGLLILSSGAIAYFGTKVEGDVMLQSPAILVRAVMGDRGGVIGRFRAEVGETWSSNLPVLGQPIQIEVAQITPLGVQPAGQAVLKIRYGMLEKELTLTTAPASWVPLSDTVQVGLYNFPAQGTFYENETPVLYLRNPASNAEVVKRIESLPIHRERYLPEEGLLKDVRGMEIPSRRITPQISLLGLKIPTGWFEPWRMPIQVDSDGLPFSIEITGYVPAAKSLQPMTMPDGSVREVPILEVPDRRRVDISPRSMSAIRLRLTGRGPNAGWSDSQWVLNSLYPDVNANPLHVHVPGSPTPWEIVYSRARHDLGATIAGEKFYVSYFPGERGIESFFSKIAIQDQDGRVHPATVQTNETYKLGRWTLFQSGFDFDTHWMYTVLGVGNRIGIWPMNVGWIIVAIGCLFAFYVKPILLRRARRRAAQVGE